GRINKFFTQRACQASSILKRTFKRPSSLQPHTPSPTDRFLPVSRSVACCFQAPQLVSVIGLLCFTATSYVNQIVFSVTASFTIYLSLGDRPVKSPVITFTAPSSATCPRSKPCKFGSVSASNKSSNDGL